MIRVSLQSDFLVRSLGDPIESLIMLEVRR
jgi:hypothetical protein